MRPIMRLAGGVGMKRMIIDRLILDCTMCQYCGFVYPDQTSMINCRRVCDKVDDPDNPGFARDISDPSIFPEWCPWEDVTTGDDGE